MNQAATGSNHNGDWGIDVGWAWGRSNTFRGNMLMARSPLLALAFLALSGCFGFQELRDRRCAQNEVMCDGRCHALTATEMLCGTSCIDVTTDEMNCGACGETCAADETCTAGQCLGSTCQGEGCPMCDATMCGSSCVDTATSPNHCGRCNRMCPADQTCRAGACVPSTTVCDLTMCGQSCVNTQTSIEHCGTCNNACGAFHECQAGNCVSTCSDTICGAACVDTQTSVNHCGRCDNACGALHECQAGSCVSTCANTICGTECIDTTSSNANCGRCGNGCGSNQHCQASVCVNNPPVCTDTMCGDQCVNTRTNRLFCGSCSHACTDSQRCIASTCIATSCPGTCVDSTSAGCEFCAPRPIAPLSNRHWYSDDVTFQWSPSAYSVRIELSRTRSFTTLQSQMVTGQTVTVTGLAEGEWFWRLRTVDATGAMGPVGRPWKIWVNDRGHAMAGEPYLDQDNDGFQDAVVVTTIGAELLRGGTNSTSVRVIGDVGTFDVADQASWGAAAAICADLNGDGDSDLAVSASGDATRGGRIGIFGVSSGGIYHINWGLDQANQLGAAITCAGDRDGDGYGDIVASRPYFTSGPSQCATTEGGVVFYYGFPNLYDGIAPNDSLWLSGLEWGAAVGSTLTSGLDFDRDGRDELLIGVPHLGSHCRNQIGTGAVFMVDGSAERMGVNLNVGPEFTGPTNSQFGITLRASMLNGPRILIGSSTSGTESMSSVRWDGTQYVQEDFSGAFGLPLTSTTAAVNMAVGRKSLLFVDTRPATLSLSDDALSAAQREQVVDWAWTRGNTNIGSPSSGFLVLSVTDMNGDNKGDLLYVERGGRNVYFCSDYEGSAMLNCTHRYTLTNPARTFAQAN